MNSAYRTIYKALKAALSREGVTIGRTSGYPRVECHSFAEGETLDKGGSLRVVSCVVESMSATSLDAAVTMNEGNLAALAGLASTDTAWRILGWRATQLQDITEATDTKAVLYRILQSIDITIQKI